MNLEAEALDIARNSRDEDVKRLAGIVATMVHEHVPLIVTTNSFGDRVSGCRCGFVYSALYGDV